METLWQASLIAGAGVIIAVLFMGPGMWSSDTEFLIVRLWRRLRHRAPALSAKADDRRSPP